MKADLKHVTGSTTMAPYLLPSGLPDLSQIDLDLGISFNDLTKPHLKVPDTAEPHASEDDHLTSLDSFDYDQQSSQANFSDLNTLLKDITDTYNIQEFNINDYGGDDFDDYVEDLGNLNELGRNETEKQLGDLLNEFMDSLEQNENISSEVWWVIVVTYGVVISLGVAGNLVILYAILSKRRMWTARNYFILCLACSDLLLCVLTMPLTLWEVLRKVVSSKEVYRCLAYVLAKLIFHSYFLRFHKAISL